MFPFLMMNFINRLETLLSSWVISMSTDRISRSALDFMHFRVYWYREFLKPAQKRGSMAEWSKALVFRHQSIR